MTPSLPITPLLALSRVDYLDSSMLCTNTAVALEAHRTGNLNSLNVLPSFRKFLPGLIGVDDLEHATPDSILHVSLLALGPALWQSGLISKEESQVQSYIDKVKEIDHIVLGLEHGDEVNGQELKKIEIFCRELSNQMTSAVEESLREVQTLPL